MEDEKNIISNNTPNEKGIIFIRFELSEGVKLTPGIRDYILEALGSIPPAINEISICRVIEKHLNI